MGMLPVRHFVVRDKQGHATCKTLCCQGYARACYLLGTLLSGVSKGMLPVRHFVVRGR